MANKSKKTNAKNKNLIIGICAAVAIVVVIIIAVVIIKNSSGISDSYFVSDGSKYVMTIDSSDLEIEEDSEEAAFAPIKSHIVYTYSGDTITSLKTYYEYKDNDSAKAALDYMKEGMGEEDGQIEVNGKYIVITAPEEQYKDLTAADVKEQIDFMNSLQNMDLDDLEDDTEDYSEESDGTTTTTTTVETTTVEETTE